MPKRPIPPPPAPGAAPQNPQLRRVNDRQAGGRHYKGLNIEPWDYIIANGIPFVDGEAIKYITRHRIKGRRVDLEKAIHCLEKIMETEYPVEDEQQQK